MGYLGIGFGVPSDWESPFFENTVYGQYVNASDSWVRIPPITITPIPLTARVIATRVIQSQDKPRWTFGGYLEQAAWTGLLTNTPENQASLLTTRLILNKIQVHFFPILPTDGYQLKVIPPSWFHDIFIEAWEFTGFVKDYQYNQGG